MRKLLFILVTVLPSLTIDAQVVKDNCLRFEQAFEEIDSISFNPMGCKGTIVLHLKNAPNFWITSDEYGCRRINHAYNSSKDTVSIDLLDESIYNDILNGNFSDYMVYYEGFFQLSQCRYWTFEVAKRDTFSKGIYKITRIRRIVDATEGAYDGFNPTRYLDITFEQLKNTSPSKTVSVIIDTLYDTNVYAEGDIFEMMESNSGVKHFIFQYDAITYSIHSNGN